MTKVIGENEDGGTAANGYDEGDVAGNQQKRQFLLSQGKRGAKSRLRVPTRCLLMLQQPLYNS